MLKIGAPEVNALRFFEKRNAFLLSFAPLGIRRFPSVRVPWGSAPAPGLHNTALPPTRTWGLDFEDIAVFSFKLKMCQERKIV